MRYVRPHVGAVFTALSLVCCAQATSPAPKASTPPAPTSPTFLEGGLPAALAEARRQQKPLVVDLWAPWCPPCMSMRANAFDAPAVQELSRSFVWLSIDRDGDEGEKVSAMWNIGDLPTLLVVDPQTGSPFARWTSTLSGAELATFLRAASTRAERAPELFGPHAEGDRRPALQSLLATGRPDWPLAPFAVYEAVREASANKDLGDCVAMASRWADRLPNASLRLSTVSTALSCAEGLGPEHEGEAARFADMIERAIGDPACDVLPGDRATYYNELYHTRKAWRDAPGAARALDAWLTYIKTESAHAPPIERGVLSAHLLLALYERGERANAIPTLLEAEQWIPNDDNVSVRVARELAEAGRLEEAIAAIDRAVAKAPWPRRLEVMWEKARLLQKKGDRDGEVKVLQTAIAAAAEGKSLSPRFARVVTTMKDRLGALSAKAEGRR